MPEDLGVLDQRAVSSRHERRASDHVSKHRNHGLIMGERWLSCAGMS